MITIKIEGDDLERIELLLKKAKDVFCNNFFVVIEEKKIGNGYRITVKDFEG